jgi:hypothetical protein
MTYLADRESDGPSEEIAAGAYNHLVDVVSVTATCDDKVRIVARGKGTIK